METRKVGKVSVSFLEDTNEKQDYTDSSEEALLKLFKNPYPQKQIESILKKNLSWPMEYHLSPDRENLLNWYPFPTGNSLLEVGAGCGALTGTLCRSLKNVTALELTRKRAEIIALRHQKFTNLEVLAGNVMNFSPKKKFDFVTCIGVLEYAGKYIDHPDPFRHLLEKLRSLLKPEGTLILAIENRLGLKYWSGVKEDHTSRLFDSIYGYPRNEGIKTFGRKELNEMLKSVGFGKQTWYYPLPDYKIPLEIFSDHYLPGGNKLFSLGVFPSSPRNSTREYIFSEELVMNSLVKNGLFPDFANSFLIFSKA